MTKLINYNQICKSYNTGLIDKLRGFGEEDYLKYWVPDEKLSKSLINLFFALFDQNIKDCIISVNLKEIKNDKILFNFISKNKLKSIFLKKCPSSYQIECKNLLYDDIDKIYKSIFGKKNLPKKNIFQENKFFNKNKAKFNLTSIENDENYIKLSKNKLVCFEKNYSFEIDKKNKKNVIKLLAEIDDTKVLILIDEKTFIILDCFFSQKKENSSSKYLDFFFQTIKYLHIREARDHGVIRMENLIEKDSKLEKKGIMLSHFRFYEFALMKKIVDILYKKLDRKFEEINKFYDVISETWLNYSKNEKKDIIKKKLDSYFKENKIEAKYSIVDIKDSHKIILNIDLIDNKLDKKSEIFLNVEKLLKKKVEFALEVFNSEKVDQNKLRLKNLPQI